MKIEKPGFYRTRDGRKAQVSAFNLTASSNHCVIGWVEGCSKGWSLGGEYCSGIATYLDLISEWTDPVPWDWSTTPPWINWIAMDRSGTWYMYDTKPGETEKVWSFTGALCHRIPKTHQPKWSGDWRQSLTVRPGYEGGAK